MTGSRLRAAPFLCPPLPLSFPDAPLQPRPSTAPSSQRAPSPRSTIRTHPSSPTSPLPPPPGGLPFQGSTRTVVSRPPPLHVPSSQRPPFPKHHPRLPLPAPSLHRPILPAGSLSETPPAPAPLVPASPPTHPPGGAPSPRRLPHPPLPAPPLHRPVLPVGPHPHDASRTDLSQPRLSDTPPSRRGPSRKYHLSLRPCFSEALFLRRGSPPPKFFLHRVPLLPPSPLSKTDLGAAFQRLPAAPGRFWALSGLFRVLFGLFRVFFEKSWAKNFLFSPASGIIKPLTGTARR